MADENTEKKVEDAPAKEAEQGDAREKTDDKDAKKKDAGKAAKPVSNVATLNDKVEISCDKPLPLYDVGPNKAYRAYSKDANKTPLIAIVCERYLVPRRDAADKYGGIINASLVKLVLRGAVYWPPAEKEYYVFVYLDNLGKPLVGADEREALGWKQDDVMPIIVKPMISILQDFHDKDFVHGAIRPQNMFDGGATGKPSKIILGDCLSTPPSYAQSVLYEPISRAMADPIARGKGTITDDLYALGVSIAVIMRQNNPLKGLNDQQIIERKIMDGSYAAVTGKDRFKGEILELLRGLLHDDPAQRWTLDEVLSWMDGRRLSPKQSIAIKKAARPFVLDEKKYSAAPLMAMDVDMHIKSVKHAISDESLKNWVERSLQDEELSERLDKAVLDSRQQSTGAGYEACLASNVSIALDANAPLRFKGRRLIGEGIGAAFVEAIVNRISPSAYAEVFLNSLVLNWLSVQNGALIDVTGLFGKFEKCRRYLKTSKYGEGMERTVYVLSPEAPCLSEIVEDYFVTGPDDLLVAFEDVCKRGRAPATFLDKHVVAFLYEKDQKVIEPQIFDLNTHENHRVVAANLKCMAAIQKRYKLSNKPAIAKVMAPRLQALVKRYHDRLVQDKLKEAVAEFQTSGDLVKMAVVFENLEMIKKDMLGFKKAMLEFKKIEEERQKLDMKLGDKAKFGLDTGREIAAIVSSVLALIIIIGTAFLFLSDKTPF